MKLLVGSSGFSYDHWSNGVFYPKKLAKNKWLNYYSQHFTTVELNVTFYRLPKKKTFIKWHKETPDEFIFAIKGNKFITHVKRLKDVKASIKMLMERAAGLKKKLGVILWQLPPQMKIDIKRLERFIRDLKKWKVRHAFEFRHDSWFTAETYGLLHSANCALCIANSPNWHSVEELTANWIYLRFHGGKELYASEYTKKELNNWSKKIKQWGNDGYVYFNNDFQGFAVKNARYLKGQLKD